MQNHSGGDSVALGTVPHAPTSYNMGHIKYLSRDKHKKAQQQQQNVSL